VVPPPLASPATSDNYGYVDASETAYLTGTGTTTGSLLDAEGTRLAVKTGSAVSWLVFDLHGSVAGICPAGSTTLSDAYRYDGWGNQVASAGSVINPYRYRGLLNLANDTGSGALLAMNAREYSPQLGTFTQQDSYAGSAANPASMNRFLYALANPATLIDPDGHMAEDVGSLSTGYTPRVVVPHQVTPIDDCGSGCFAIDPRIIAAAQQADAIRAAGGDPFKQMDPIRQALSWQPTSAGAGIFKGLCNLTLCGFMQLLSDPVGTVSGTIHVGATVGNSVLSGRAVDDFVRGWTAMQQMTDGQKAELWTTIIGGGVSAGTAANGAINAARAARAAMATRTGESLSIVQGTLNEVGAMSFEQLLGMNVLKPKQIAQLLGNAKTAPMFAGHLVHNAVDTLLRLRYGDRFVYRPSLGADIFDRVTGQLVEIATQAQEAYKAAKYPDADIATYFWSPWVPKP
jgi:RHS repeat-associated protein